jgi:hypothetical protein
LIRKSIVYHVQKSRLFETGGSNTEKSPHKNQHKRANQQLFSGYSKQVAATSENLHTKIGRNMVINNYFRVCRINIIFSTHFFVKSMSCRE